jgi:hypothetical protein
MRSVYLICLLLLSSCGTKNQEQPVEETQESKAPIKTSAEILQSLKLISFPFSTENLPRHVYPKEVQHYALPNETVGFMQLQDKPEESSGGDFYYWMVGKVGEEENYTAAVIGYLWFAGSTVLPARYSIVTFTPEGKRIESFTLSEETGEEGWSYETDALIREKEIIVKSREANVDLYFDTPRNIVETGYHLDKEGKLKKTDSRKYPEEIQVTWYHGDGGLLSIEKARGNDIRFLLNRESNEGCTPQIDGIARLQEDGTYSYPGDENNLLCAILLKISPDKIEVSPEDLACPNASNCAYEGDYNKIVIEKISPQLNKLTSWPDQPVEKFACTLEKIFSYKDPGFTCGIKLMKDDPSNEDPLYYTGPAFPKEKIPMVHPLIEDIEIGYEHGEIRTVRVVLKNKLTVQSIQRIFELPRFNSPEPGSASNIWKIEYDNLNEEDIDPVKPTLVKEFTLIAFEHIGSGD